MKANTTTFKIVQSIKEDGAEISWQVNFRPKESDKWERFHIDHEELRFPHKPTSLGVMMAAQRQWDERHKPAPKPTALEKRIKPLADAAEVSVKDMANMIPEALERRQAEWESFDGVRQTMLAQLTTMRGFSSINSLQRNFRKINESSDYDSIRGWDLNTRTIAEMFPELGIDEDDLDRLFRMVIDPNNPRPKKFDQETLNLAIDLVGQPVVCETPF